MTRLAIPARLRAPLAPKGTPEFYCRKRPRIDSNDGGFLCVEFDQDKGATHGGSSRQLSPASAEMA